MAGDSEDVGDNFGKVSAGEADSSVIGGGGEREVMELIVDLLCHLCIGAFGGLHGAVRVISFGVVTPDLNLPKLAVWIAADAGGLVHVQHKLHQSFSCFFNEW